MSIAYATLDHLLKNIRCRTLFATHYHELATMLTNRDDGKVREGVDFYCTDVNEGVRQSHLVRDKRLMFRTGLLVINTNSDRGLIRILMLSYVFHKPMRITLTSTESSKTSWYAGIFPLNSAKHLRQPSGYSQVNLDDVEFCHRFTMYLIDIHMYNHSMHLHYILSLSSTEQIPQSTSSVANDCEDTNSSTSHRPCSSNPDCLQSM